MATTERYVEGIGRRKTASARVRITPSKKVGVTVNDKAFEVYFPTKELQRMAMESLGERVFGVSVHVQGGGISSQAEAVRLGIARALLKHDPALRLDLKQKGFLTRDPRAVERKKFGLKKARRAPQFSKR
jgi:small subunit ribosomal protein S9